MILAVLGLQVKDDTFLAAIPLDRPWRTPEFFSTRRLNFDDFSAHQRQLVTTIRALLWDALPDVEQDKLCLECKRQQYVCVMVTQGIACMGPVTRNGCGALCPSLGRGCYGCYGPGENPNTSALGKRFEDIGLRSGQIANQFLAINNQAEPFRAAGKNWKDKS